MSNDWRLANQMNYLFKKKLIKKTYKPYNEKWEHEHCEFCSEKIGCSERAYSTKDEYYWICNDCFEDFKDMFEWKVTEN